MKKFSRIDKVDLTDNQLKTYEETLSALFDDLLSVKLTGEGSELAGNVDITIDGKEKFIYLVEKLTKIHILKENAKLLADFKAKAYKENGISWVDKEINNINESVENLICGKLPDSSITISVEEKVIDNNK